MKHVPGRRLQQAKRWPEQLRLGGPTLQGRGYRKKFACCPILGDGRRASSSFGPGINSWTTILQSTEVDAFFTPRLGGTAAKESLREMRVARKFISGWGFCRQVRGEAAPSGET